MHAQVGQIMNNIQKSQVPVGTSEVPEQKQGSVRDPCPQHHQGSGQTLKDTLLARPTDLPSPSCHLRKQATNFLFSLPLATGQAP